MIQGTAQFGRAYQLIVSSSSVINTPLAESAAPLTTQLDLSNLRFTFSVKSMDVETPNTLTVRVYNPSASTVAAIKQGEFTKVTLSAGYEANVNYGVIFYGDIKRVNIGREDNVNSYVEILAGDGDLAYNFGIVNTTVGANSSPQQRFAVLSDRYNNYGISTDPNAQNAFTTVGGILPRGAVLFGLIRDEMAALAQAAQARWSIQKGVLTVIPNSGYLPGEAVVLNSQSGLIGVPEVTDNGVNVRMLLNAKLRIGGLVSINQNLINQQIVQQQGYPSYTGLYFPAQTASDGTYRVLVINHAGDTRGQGWYTDIVCLAVNVAAPGSPQQYACQEFPG